MIRAIFTFNPSFHNNRDASVEKLMDAMERKFHCTMGQMAHAVLTMSPRIKEIAGTTQSVAFRLSFDGASFHVEEVAHD